jgi:hypothetical protein
MNEIMHPDVASDVPWPISVHRVRLPEAPMFPGMATAAPPVDGLPNPVEQYAHEAMDRPANSLAPAAQQPGEPASAAGDALHTETDALLETQGNWTESVRTSVRGNPLASMAAAVVLGAVIARIAR